MAVTELYCSWHRRCYPCVANCYRHASSLGGNQRGPQPTAVCTAQISSGILQELAGICWPSRESGEVTDVVTVNVDCSTSIPATFFYYSQHDGHRASLSNVLSILSSICHMCCFLNISLPPPGAKKLDKDILKYFSHLPGFFFLPHSLPPHKKFES